MTKKSCGENRISAQQQPVRHSGTFYIDAANPHIRVDVCDPARKKGPIYQALADSQIHKLSIVKNSACYLPGQFQQVGTGPAFSAVLIGAAAARQVQATPTTRTKVLNARVISISYMRVPWERKP